MARSVRKTSKIVWLRRCIQTLCLLLFFYLFLQTAYHPINRTGGPVTFFFELDPLVLAAVWLAGAAVPLALFLSLGTLGISVLFGRWARCWDVWVRIRYYDSRKIMRPVTIAGYVLRPVRPERIRQAKQRAAIDQNAWLALPRPCSPGCCAAEGDYDSTIGDEGFGRLSQRNPAIALIGTHVAEGRLTSVR